MVEDDTVAGMLSALLAQRLRELQRLTGLPIVFGGAVRRTPLGSRLEITQLRGTVGSGLRGLRVASGRGLGGTALSSGSPCLVEDYATAAAITHDFDRHVVQEERITSVFALPIRFRGGTGGILYGAVRDTTPIGGRTLRQARDLALGLERELRSIVAPPSTADGAPPGTRTALDELARISARIGDPAIRADLERIHRELGGRSADPGPGRGATIRLAPREREVLQLVELGCTNVEIGARLGLREQTVKAYLRSAARRLAARNRTAAVHAARTLGLL